MGLYRKISIWSSIGRDAERNPLRKEDFIHIYLAVY